MLDEGFTRREKLVQLRTLTRDEESVTMKKSAEDTINVSFNLDNIPSSPTQYVEYILTPHSKRKQKKQKCLPHIDDLERIASRCSHKYSRSQGSFMENTPSHCSDLGSVTTFDIMDTPVLRKYSHVERMSIIRKFHRSTVFGNLTKEKICKLSLLMSEVEFGMAETIVRQGEQYNLCYIIMSGKVKLTVTCPDTKKTTFLRFKEPGSVFGEEIFISDVVTSPYNIVADGEDVDCLIIDAQTYQELSLNLEASRKDQKQAELEHEILFQKYLNTNTYKSLTLNDFKILGTLGTGAYGKVKLVQHSIPDIDVKTMAMKCIQKPAGDREISHIKMEKSVMIDACDCSFIVRCYHTLQNSRDVFLLLEPCLGGDLFTLVRDCEKLDKDSAKFYMACVVEGLEYLHNKNIVYRDLKPENVLLDRRGYAKLTDFGFAKRLTCHSDFKTWSFCGTPSYLAPEVILNKGHDTAVDFWAFGILLCELLTGRSPFRCKNVISTYNKVLEGIDKIELPNSLTQSAHNLIQLMCRESPSDRLGYKDNGWMEVRRHTWFDGLDWCSLRAGEITPTYIPEIRTDTDMSNFDLVSSSSDSSDSALGEDIPLVTATEDVWRNF